MYCVSVRIHINKFDIICQVVFLVYRVSAAMISGSFYNTAFPQFHNFCSIFCVSANWQFSQQMPLFWHRCQVVILRIVFLHGLETQQFNDFILFVNISCKCRLTTQLGKYRIAYTSIVKISIKQWPYLTIWQLLSRCHVSLTYKLEKCLTFSSLPQRTNSSILYISSSDINYWMSATRKIYTLQRCPLRTTVCRRVKI